jgi:hypothetical protein
MGLGESELYYDGGNVFFKFEVDICISFNVMGQVHKSNTKSILKEA